MKFFVCYTGTTEAGGNFNGDATMTADALTPESIEAARKWLINDLKRNHNTAVAGRLIFVSITRLDEQGRGCAACDRGDFQLGHAEWCPKAKAAPPASAPPCGRCGGMGWVPSKGDGDTDPCPECLHPDLA